ncbi:MAG TPA: aldehyde dehydrogenase family protein [Polyangia bacterium]|jgi:phenylacetaldehyde dehydrogenase|nr:aldehyde dehydrogenase family protein [Polyangia bacterium]
MDMSAPIPVSVAKQFLSRPQANLIGKERAPAISGRTIKVLDPATGELLMTTPDSGQEDIHRAVMAARAAFDSGPWTRMTPYERARLMLKLADLIEKHQGELAEIETLDTGKPIMASRYVDVPLTLNQFHFFAGLATKVRGNTMTLSCPYTPGQQFHSYTLREPVGVAGLITPFNFPMLLGAMKIAPALAAGCTIVLKPDERTPGSSLRMAELALEAGIPEGVFNVVTGGPDAGAALAAHDAVDKIAFTGSTEAGRSILRAAAGNLKKVSLELGGNSPNIVLDDADVAAAVQGAGFAAYVNMGECCVAGARLFVQDKVYDQVVEGLIGYANGLKIGAGIDESTQMGPLITPQHLDKVCGYIESGRQAGAKIVAGGERVQRPGYFVQPTVVTNTRDDMKIVTDEVFGPVATVSRFSDVDQVIRQANNTMYGLAAGVWTRDLSKAHRMASALQAGTVWINCYNIFDTALPFGGYKQSGWGRESCPEAIDLYTQVKAVCVAL